jgi:replicative DNA helicase
MNIELRLLSTMLKSGDFSPIIKNEVTREHFETSQGESIYDFIVGYKEITEGAASWPSLAIVRERFRSAAIELPDPDPADNVENLTTEVRVTKFRSDVRQFALDAETAATAALDPLGAVLPLIEKLRKATESQQRVNHISLRTGIRGVIQRYEAKEILPQGISYPWPTLSKATKGMHPGEFIVIAGRPKARKTFTALRILTDAMKNDNARVLVLSPEMKPEQMHLRCIAHLCNLPYAEFKDSSMQKAEEARLYEALAKYELEQDMTEEAYKLKLKRFIPGLGDKMPSLDIVQSTGRDTQWIAAQIELYRPDIILCDSFYKQRTPGSRKNDSDWKIVAAVSRELKDLAMETNTTIIATHQLNREAQKSVGDISNLALADAVGQDADAIFRVITVKLNGQDISAIWNMGTRDVATEGVIINNRPCYDFAELGAIESKRQVQDLMKREDEQLAKEANEELERKLAQQPGATTTTSATHVASTLVKTKGVAGKGIRRRERTGQTSPFAPKKPPVESTADGRLVRQRVEEERDELEANKARALED